MTKEKNNTNNVDQVENTPKSADFKLKVNTKALVVVFGIILFAFAVYAAKGFFVPAVVNGQPISRFRVIQELERRSGQQVLEGLINQALLVQEAKQRGITVTGTEIDADIKQIDDNMKAQGSSLDEALAAQNLTFDEFKVLLKTNKVLEKLIADRVAVTDEEISEYYNSNKASFPADSTLDQVKEQIRSFLQQQKVDSESSKLFAELRAKAKIYLWRTY